MTSDDHRYDPPQKTRLDTGHTLIRAGLGSIPLVGAASTEIFQLLITPPLETRREEWMRTIGESLKKLEESGRCRLEDLHENEVFIDAVLQASQVSIRNSNQNKKEALKNAILNAALSKSPAEALQQMFINWIDEFTDWHLKILNFFNNPRKWLFDNNKQIPEDGMSSLSGILTAAYPELSNRRDFYDQIAKDLHARGLLKTGNLHVTMTYTGAYQSAATTLGQQFLSFISNPD